MVSLLIVSHSAQVAAGVKELAAQMGGGRVAVAAAGGSADGSLGTNADAIQEALMTLPGNEILVLVDLGSAVMSAEIALETSGKHYIISNAPLVEGAVFAAALASTGASLEETAAEAEKTRTMV